MRFSFLLAASAATAALQLSGCQTSKPRPAASTASVPTPAPPAAPGTGRLASGTEYQLFRRPAAGGRYAPRPLDVPGDAPYSSRAGQVLMVSRIQYRTDRDSLLMDSRNATTDLVPVPLPATPVPGTIEEGMALLLPGDSAAFRFPADTVFAKSMHQPVPAFLRRSGNALRMSVVAQEVITPQQFDERRRAAQAEAQKQAAARAAQRLTQDDAQIVTYLKEHDLYAKAKKTPGGTWYYLTQRGSGPLPQAGQPVKVKYRGTVLATGQEFDSSEKHGGTPFEFTLGQGQVIQGWDQGIAMLPKGSKAVLLIPSPLAYGERGAGGDIPPNAPLRFEVELPGAASAPAAAKKPAVKRKK